MPLMVAATTSATSPPKRTLSDQDTAEGPASTGAGTGAPAPSPARSRTAPSMDSSIAVRAPLDATSAGRPLSRNEERRGIRLQFYRLNPQPVRGVAVESGRQ